MFQWFINKFKRPKKHVWRVGERIYTDDKICIVILTVPCDKYKYYDISLSYENIDNIQVFTSASLSNIDAYQSKYDIYRFETINIFIRYLRIGIIFDRNTILYEKVKHRFNTAAILIQYAWRKYTKLKFIQQKKAVILIEKHALHMLYRPCGRLAPTKFTTK